MTIPVAGNVDDSNAETAGTSTPAGQSADGQAFFGSRGSILLIGASGMLGRAWRQWLESHRLDYTAPPSSVLDLNDPASLKRFDTKAFGCIVNCAAFTDVDGAEAQSAKAQRINGDAVEALAHNCQRDGNLLVHYSTDYVFDGQACQPYATDEPVSPVNAYGVSKAFGEMAVRESGCGFLLIRTSWLYAPWGKNFVYSIADQVRRRPAIEVVNDQRSRPTSCEPLVRNTFQLMQKGARGIYHVTDGGACTWYDFARKIGKYINPNCGIEPCSTPRSSRRAQRPGYSVLDISGTETFLGPMRIWPNSLADVLSRL